MKTTNHLSKSTFVHNMELCDPIQLPLALLKSARKTESEIVLVFTIFRYSEISDIFLTLSGISEYQKIILYLS